MQEIVDRLEKLGTSEYARRFAGDPIDLAVLPDRCKVNFLVMQKGHAPEGACTCAGAFHAAFSERAVARRDCHRAAF
jgi:hypothetical protein